MGMTLAAMLAIVPAASASTSTAPTITTKTAVHVSKPVRVASGLTGHAAYCANATYSKWGVDLFQIVQYKVWNHSHWCYYKGGKVYLRTGYIDTYVADGWHTVRATWAKSWYNPYSQWQSVAHATFDFIIAGQQTQERNISVCIVMGNQGGDRWC